MVIPRHDFAREYFDYKPGEHVVFGGPTQKGKTTLAFDLLDPICTPDFPAYIAVSKPDDKVTRMRGHQMDLRFTTDWPAPVKLKEWYDGKPRGYVVWPQFGDIETDIPRSARVTSKLMADRYAKGAKGKRGILVMDDTMVKAKILGLDGQMTTIIAMGGAMGLGIWVFVQKPTDTGKTPLWAYDNAEHIFLTKGGDHRMLLRYSEIAGIDGTRVRQIIPTLGEYQFLYIHKSQDYLCIVDRD